MSKAPTLNVNDIVHDLHRTFHHHGLSKKALEELVRGTFETILERVSRGEPVNVRNFGTFSAKMLKSRILKTPLMEKSMRFPEQLVLRFKQSGVAKAIINQESVKHLETKAAILAGGKRVKVIASAPDEDEDSSDAPKAKRGRPKGVPNAKQNPKPPKAVPVEDDEVADGFEHSKAVKKPKAGAEAKAVEKIKPAKQKKAEKALAEEVEEVAAEKPAKQKKVKAAPVPVVEEIEDDLEEDEEIEEDEDLEDDDTADLTDDEDEEIEEDEPVPAPKKGKKAK